MNRRDLPHSHLYNFRIIAMLPLESFHMLSIVMPLRGGIPSYIITVLYPVSFLLSIPIILLCISCIPLRASIFNTSPIYLYHYYIYIYHHTITILYVYLLSTPIILLYIYLYYISM